jgi:hypothetical protein
MEGMHLSIGNLFPPTTRLYRTEKSIIDSCFPAAADLIPLSTHLSGKTPPLSAIHLSLPESQKGAAKNGIFFAQTTVTTHPYCKTLPRHSSPAHFLRRAVIGSILNTHRLCSTIFYSVLCSGLSLIPRTLPLLSLSTVLLQRHAPSHLPKMRHSPKRRYFPIFPPFVSQLGGAPRPSRRQCLSEVVVLAALPVLPAAHFGGKFHSALRSVFTHPLFSLCTLYCLSPFTQSLVLSPSFLVIASLYSLQ